MRTLIVLAVIALPACKSKRDATPVSSEAAAPADAARTPDAAQPDPAPTTGNIVDLADAKLIADPGGTLTIDTAGKVTLNGKHVATLGSTGELTSNGVLVSELHDDDRIEIMGWGPGLQLAVRADGAVLDHGKVVLAPKPDGTLDGEMLKTDELLKGAKLRLDGDKRGYRAAVFAWLSVSMSDRIKKK